MKTSLLCLMAAAGLFSSLPIAVEAQKTPANPMPAALRSAGTPIRLRFVNTDVSDILQAISVQTHANIVFPSQLKKLISVNMTSDSTRGALTFVAAAGGLAFRQVGQTFVVAPPAELRLVLEPFGEKAHIPLKTLTVEQAQKLVEGAYPYLTVRPGGNQLILIGAAEDLEQAQALLAEQDRPHAIDPMTSEVAVLKYASATQMATMLKSLYPEIKAEPVGQADKSGGVIGLAGPRSQIESAKEAIHHADLPIGPQDPGTAYRVYTIRYSSAAVLRDFMEKAIPAVITLVGPDSYSPPAPTFHPITGANLSASGGSGGGASGAGGASGGGAGGAGGADPGAAAGDTGQAKQNARAKFLVLRGAPAELDNAVQLLEQVDIAPKQVMVEVRVVDTSPEHAEEVGLQFSYSPLGLLEGAVGSSFGTETTRPKQLGYFSRLPLGVQAKLNALITSKDAKLLANPRVQVLDNDDANIFIGDTIRTQVSQSSLSGTTLQVLEFPVGIILLVHPRVNADGKITMRVHPVVSTVTGLGAGNLPQTSSREAETTVMVQDGETIVIGGLIRDEMSKVVEEVPFLSKLPLVGQLFRNRSTNHRHSEIMVFITTHVIK